MESAADETRNQLGFPRKHSESTVKNGMVKAVSRPESMRLIWQHILVGSIYIGMG